MLLDQGPHQHRNGGRRRRDHARPATDQGDDHGNGERGVEPQSRVNAGDDGKADGFRDKRKGNDDARKNVVARIGHPFATKRRKKRH
ncbi:hypothetical protein D3C71_1730840 [compost metagenome]